MASTCLISQTKVQLLISDNSYDSFRLCSPTLVLKLLIHDFLKLHKSIVISLDSIKSTLSLWCDYFVYRATIALGI